MTGGPWAGRKCIGCSLAVGPGGAILAEGPYAEISRNPQVIEAYMGSAEAAHG